ncbi:metallophosphoesterase [Gemella sp. oral taxon 928]|uniref:metallophosphoesterase n=1 Tax=Gemella sp. oral taxon 928 TaxID=1785995 RepID=UPI000B0C7DB7|nr:metallophosphoesterase [Gemella sp. oral taxon 928]
MLGNWKTFAVFIGVAVFYEFLILLLWFGLKWMITPYTTQKVRLWLCIILFIVADFSILSYILRLGAPIVNYGNIWFFYFSHGFVALVVLTILYRILKLFKISLSQGISLTLTGIFLLNMTALGLFWAYSPTVKNQTVKVNKHLEKPLKIAMVADLHLGTFFGNNQLEKLNTIIENQKPDVVIIAGDIMDDDMVMYKKLNMGKTLSKLHAPLGVYTVMGNHDHNTEDIINEISKTGIKTLADETVKLTDDITLVGRKDRSVSRDRLTTMDLLKNVDTDKTTILIDHQPNAVETHSLLPIDVQLSGHTHRGQIWPFNYITDKVYVLDHGYKKINNKHFFTTSGYGFWGPPFKTTARSEVWIINLEGK